MKIPHYDIFIIGGGINGAGIACDAAGRGLKTGLCEQHDFASGTSSASSKLIHGGLRYLEYYEFGLVRKALKEREVLLKKAPHIIWPLQFILPHNPDMRPAWIIRAGLFLYDHLAARQQLPKSHSVNLASSPLGTALLNSYTKGFCYADCWVDDARLVILNIMAAKELGADIYSRYKCIDAKRKPSHWLVTLQNSNNGLKTQITTRALINAGGPWVDDISKHNIHMDTNKHIQKVKGSHFVIPKFYQGNHAYILQNEDKRVIFVSPYEQDYLLIGTTDVAFTGNPNDAAITDAEIDYLISSIARYFHKKIRHNDIVWSYAGVRPLQGDESSDPTATTRDYSFELDQKNVLAPLLTIFGGKLTTYRTLAEEILNSLNTVFPKMKKAWTASSILPGGDIPNCDFDAYTLDIAQQYPWLPQQLAFHYCRHYGTLIHKIIAGCKNINDLGKHFGGLCYQIEIDYLMKNEWAQTIDDLIWRRTKHGLSLKSFEIKKLIHYIQK